MQFTTAFAAAIAMATAATASPLAARQSTCNTVTSGSDIYKISDVFTRKLNGLNGGVSSAGFTVTNTANGATSSCAPYDVSTGEAVTTGVKDNTFYSCGVDSAFEFAFNDASNGLLLKLRETETAFSVGTTTLPIYYHAGPVSNADYVGTGTSDQFVTLVGYPSA